MSEPDNADGSAEPRADDHDDRPDRAVLLEAAHQARLAMFGPFGMGGGPRRCSFCDRREDAVSKLVRARGSHICDRCVRLAAAAIEDAPTGKRTVRIKPRPAVPEDRESAEEAIERAFELWLSDATDAERCRAIERGENLAPTMREVRERFGVSDFVDVSVETIRFVDETEAQVSFVILLPGGNQVPSKGYAVVDDREWKVARATYADHVGRIGVSVPPPE